MSDAKLRALQDPAKRARVAAAGAENLRTWHRDGGYDWRAHHKRRGERAMAWCPPARRAEYAAARRAVGAAEARRIIEADLTPFERQLAKAASGVRFVEVQPLPSRAYDFTLGGVATGQL